MKYRVLTTLFFTLSLVTNIYSQGEISTDENLVFREEKSYGISVNTNGWSFDYRTGKFINARKTKILLYSLNTVKHQQEIKQTNYNYTSNRYVYGKLNSCFDFRFGYGFQNQVFRKEDVGSVEIRVFGTVGPILAFMKPIYYEISDSTDRIEKFLPSHQPATIMGRASFFKGISEIKANPGVFFNFGIGFEHGKKSTQLRSIDVGFSAYLYLLEMEIMANNYNSHFFLTLYATYRIGKFSHGRHLSKLNEEENLFEK